MYEKRHTEVKSPQNVKSLERGFARYQTRRRKRWKFFNLPLAKWITYCRDRLAYIGLYMFLFKMLSSVYCDLLSIKSKLLEKLADWNQYICFEILQNCLLLLFSFANPLRNKSFLIFYYQCRRSVLKKMYAYSHKQI